jgi:phosphocarrier protein HPr
MEVVMEKVKIINRLGFHLRAAAEFVNTSSKFKCRILVRHHYNDANGKSLLNLVTLAAGYGSELTLIFKGEDAKDARESLRELFLNKFGETE